MAPKKKAVKQTRRTLDLEDIPETPQEQQDMAQVVNELVHKFQERKQEAIKEKRKTYAENTKVNKAVKSLTANIFKNVIKQNQPVGCIFRYFIASFNSQGYVVYDYDIASVAEAWNNVNVGDVLCLDAFVDMDGTFITPPGGHWGDVAQTWSGSSVAQRVHDTHLFRRIVDALKGQDDDTYSKMQHLLDYLIVVQILWKGDADEAANQRQNFNARRLRDQASQLYISSPYSTFKINKEFTSMDNFLMVSDDTMDELINLKESCMVKMIVRTFKDSYDKYYGSLKDSTLSQKRLTIQSIVRTCKSADYDGGEIELTVDEATKWFSENKVGVEFYNMNHELIYKYHPQKFHSHIRPAILRVIYHNEHVQKIDAIKRFEQTCTNRDVQPTQLSNKIKVRNGPMDVEKMTCNIVKSFDDMVDQLQRYMHCDESIKSVEYDSDHVQFIYNDFLQHEFLLPLLKLGYNPEITTHGRINVDYIKLTGFTYYKDGAHETDIVDLTITIRTACLIEGHSKSEFNNMDQYKEYVYEGSKFESMLMSRDNISYLTGNVKDAFNMYGVQIHTGKITSENFETQMASNFVCLDNVKFYTSCLRDAPYIPVISPFEQFVQPENGHKVRDDCLYVVDFGGYVCSTNGVPHFITDPFHNKNVTMMYGFELKELDIDHKILAYIPVIARPIDDIKNQINSLYSDQCNIDEKIKKAVINKAIGKCGKKYNRKRLSMTFNNPHDADMWIQRHKKGATFPLDDGIWVVTMIDEIALENGFLPIYQMVLSMARMRLYKQYKELTNAGIDVVAFKTDAVFIRQPEQRKVKEALSAYLDKNIKNELGGMKIEEGKLPPNVHMEQIIVCGEKHQEFKRHLKPISDMKRDLFSRPEFDEYDVVEVESRITPNTLAASFAGRGKSHALINYAKKKHGESGVLVVCSWNSQAKNAKHKYKVDAITYHNLQGEALNGERKKPFDVNGKKCIIFDEILLFTHRQLVHTREYMQEHEEIEFLATCDPSQLEAIGDIIDNNTKLRYVEKLFPNVLTLKINKRIHDESMKNTLYNIERDLFVKQIPPSEIVQKYFNDNIISDLEQMKKDKITRGVSYLDSTAKTLNAHIHSYFQHSKKMATKVKTLVNGVTYYYSGSLICKANLKVQNNRMFPNYEYKIVKMNNKTFTLMDVLDKETMYEVSIDSIVKNFSLPYVNTVHSSQGSDIPQKYVIADWKRDDITINWLYTAITRTTSLDDVYFLDFNTKEQNKLSVAKMMVATYKIQDKNAKREYDNDMFVTPEWIVERHRQYPSCRTCGCYMSFEKHADNKLSVNRINNDLAHTKANCELLCAKCNKCTGTGKRSSLNTKGDTICASEIVDINAAKQLLEKWETIIPHHSKQQWTVNGRTYDPYTIFKRYVEEAVRGAGKVKTIYKCSSTRKTGGRKFVQSGLGLQSLPRCIRHTLAHTIYHDIDMVNCQPNILKQMCEKKCIPCDALSHYVNRRDECLAEVISIWGCTKDDAKKMILAMINNGFSMYEGFADKHKPPAWLKSFAEEMGDIHEKLMNDPANKELVDTLRAAKRKNLRGSVINHLMCDVEDKIIMACVDFMKSKEIPTDVIVLVFDGFMIPKKSVDVTNDFLQEMRKYAHGKTGYDMRFIVKPMDEVIRL